MVKLTFDNAAAKLGKPLDPRKLTTIELPNKLIDDLGSFSKFELLESVDLSNNRLSFPRQIEGLFDAKKTLKSLKLIGNPITKSSNYRIYIIYNLPLLEILDDEEVTATERDLAVRVIGKGESLSKTNQVEVDLEEEEELKAIRERGLKKQEEDEKCKEIEKEARKIKRQEEERLALELAEKERRAYEVATSEVKSEHKKTPTKVEKNIKEVESSIQKVNIERKSITVEEKKSSTSIQEVKKTENSQPMKIEVSTESKPVETSVKKGKSDANVEPLESSHTKENSQVTKTMTRDVAKDIPEKVRVTEESLFGETKHSLPSMYTKTSKTDLIFDNDDSFLSEILTKKKETAPVLIEEESLFFVSKGNNITDYDELDMILGTKKKSDDSNLGFDKGFNLTDYLEKSKETPKGGLFD